MNYQDICATVSSVSHTPVLGGNDASVPRRHEEDQPPTLLTQLAHECQHNSKAAALNTLFTQAEIEGRP